MKSNNIKIGVLGGIGPESSSYFYQKLIETFQNTFHPQNNTDFPQIIINSLPAPELISDKKILNEEIKVYQQGIKELSKHDLDIVVMTCNTIHLFYKELQQVSKIKILNFKKSISNKIKENKSQDVCVLGTTNTIKKGLYFVANKNYIDLDKKTILNISQIIENYNLGIKKENQIFLFNKLVKKLLKETNAVIVLGCTELSLLNKVSSARIISSLDVMVEETINFIKKNTR